MTDRRAALDEVHQSLHEEYHGTMTRDDIIRLAREAGASPLHGGETALFGDAAIERFAELVAAAEREACAKVCCDMIDAEYKTGKVDHNEMAWTQYCAEAIRARGDV